MPFHSHPACLDHSNYVWRQKTVLFMLMFVPLFCRHEFSYQFPISHMVCRANYLQFWGEIICPSYVLMFCHLTRFSCLLFTQLPLKYPLWFTTPLPMHDHKSLISTSLIFRLSVLLIAQFVLHDTRWGNIINNIICAITCHETLSVPRKWNLRVKFVILTNVATNCTVFWAVTPCSLVNF
jgi:hypothetical protein